MKRREFVNFVGLGMLATSLPIALAACTATKEPVATGTPLAGAPLTPPAATGGFAKVGDLAALDKDGALVIKVGGVDAVVMRDPGDRTKVVAVSAVCTHKGCTVAWKGDKLVCPCHGASFDAAGKVLEGPAKAPLKVLAAKVVGSDVMVMG
jgi:cytochrome b6-f complex iron-sulfur subunit